MEKHHVIANGREIEARLPCSIEEFLVAQKLLPRSVVVEHNGEAVAPSEFSRRMLANGDRLEIVRIVAGGGGNYEFHRGPDLLRRNSFTCNSKTGRKQEWDAVERVPTTQIGVLHCFSRHSLFGFRHL